MAFTTTQLRQLKAKLDPKHIKTRKAAGATLHYIEGWRATEEANRIFGFDGWDRETVSESCVWSGKEGGDYASAYIAKVRVRVRAGETIIVREGSGSGEARAGTPGQAHELALKSAETDATKRALASFGNVFGLALYDRERAGVRGSARHSNSSKEQQEDRWVLRSKSGSPELNFETSVGFAEALRQRLQAATTIDELFDVWVQNVATVRQLHRFAARYNGADRTPGIELVTELKLCARRLVETAHGSERETTPSSETVSASKVSQHRIDKSVLTIGEPKRIRSKEHLRFVGSQPCVICGRTPSHAHHIRYAQPRGLALKVSDEFTVPLCAIHHGENHSTGNERRWWAERKIDPLTIASELWSKSMQPHRDKYRSKDASGTQLDP